jgi:cation transport ATPase
MADAPAEGEFKALKRKAIVAGIVGTATMFVPMSWAPQVAWPLLLVTGAVMAWAGRHVYRRAYRALRHGSPDTNTLVALGTGAAFLYSAAATIAPGAFATRGIAPDLYYEVVIVIIALVTAGNALDAWALAGSGAEPAGLSRTQPEPEPARGITDRISAVFVPVVVVIAVGTFVTWWLAGGNAARGLAAAVTVLVISCPSAISIAAPAAVLVSRSRTAEPVTGDPRSYEPATPLARRIMRTTRQNLFFAFLFNVLGIPIAAGLLYPWIGVLLSPAIASGAIGLSVASVVANSARLKLAGR